MENRTILNDHIVLPGLINCYHNSALTLFKNSKRNSDIINSYEHKVHLKIDDYFRDLSLAKTSGLDLVRVHGHVAHPDLYKIADRLGLLIFQDFPLQRGYSRTIRSEAIKQSARLVQQLGHHPSIVLWNGHNEPLPPVPAAAQDLCQKLHCAFLLFGSRHRFVSVVFVQECCVDNVPNCIFS